MVHDTGYGAILQSAHGDTKIHISGFAYVDNADTIQAGDPNTDIRTLVHKRLKHQIIPMGSSNQGNWGLNSGVEV